MQELYNEVTASVPRTHRSLARRATVFYEKADKMLKNCVDQAAEWNGTA